MATITFDTYKFIRTLKEAGVPESQAEAFSEAFKEASAFLAWIDKPYLSGTLLATIIGYAVIGFLKNK